MYRVKSFKWNEKDPEAKVVYTIVRQEGDERHVLECSDPPKPELLAALQGLEQDALRECEVVKLGAPDIPGQVAIRSVSFSWALDIMGASICLLVKLDYSDQPLVLNTPHKPSQPYSEAGGHTLPPELVTKLESLHVLIERYIDGDRVKKQTDLFDDEESESRELPNAECSVSLNGGPAIPLGKFQRATKSIAKSLAGAA